MILIETARVLTQLLAITAVATSASFTSSVVTIAWSRLAIWRTMPDKQFVDDFANTIRVADKMQPIVLCLSLLSTLGVGLSSHGMTQILAFAAYLIQIVILLLSLGILVPLQQTLIKLYHTGMLTPKQLHMMRATWCTGHFGRSIISAIMLLVVISMAYYSTL